jgi:hypothetical protein
MATVIVCGDGFLVRGASDRNLVGNAMAEEVSP